MNKILVIEDDLHLGENIVTLLKNEGFLVEHATDGISGLEKVIKFFPHLILCDVMIPKMDGLQLLNELMKDINTASIPFIFLTAKVGMNNLRNGMLSGADDYFFKPFNFDELLQAINTRLKKRENNNHLLNQIQEQISMKIPHELRTPLIPIMGFSELIEEENDIELVKKMARSVSVSAKLLHKRIEKFLLYKDLVIQKYDNNKEKSNESTFISKEFIKHSISKIAEDLNPTERVKITVEKQIIFMPEWLFENLIQELTENALQFSLPNNSVTINGFQENNWYIIRVLDSGSGMTASETDSITPFNKHRQDRQCEPGFGLGLAIVKEITELYSGTFSIESEINNFTSVQVSFPLKFN